MLIGVTISKQRHGCFIEAEEVCRAVRTAICEMAASDPRVHKANWDAVSHHLGRWLQLSPKREDPYRKAKGWKDPGVPSLWNKSMADLDRMEYQEPYD